jgi:hypothetical protein
MDPLCDPLTTRPIQTGWEFTIAPYPSGEFGFIDDPDRQVGNGSVWARTWTRSDGPEPLLTLHIDLCFQADSQECRAYLYVFDLNIILGSHHECQLNIPEARSECICDSVVDVFESVISSTQLPGFVPLPISCSVAPDLIYPVPLTSLASFRKLHIIFGDLVQINSIELCFQSCITSHGKQKHGCCLQRLVIVNPILSILIMFDITAAA